MVSSMGGNDVGDVIDGNVASKAEDVGDNGGMTCGGEVFETDEGCSAFLPLLPYLHV